MQQILDSIEASLFILSVLITQQVEVKTALAEGPVVAQVATTSPKALITQYAKEYNVSENDMSRVIKCESNFNPKAINKKDPNGGSHGIAQFQTRTFDSWSVKAGIEDGDPYNPDDAIKTMAFMFSKGQQKQWSCWRIVNSSKGE